MAKERYQNPVVGDAVNLRLFTYNSNELADLSSIDKVEIYFLDPSERSEANPDGRVLVEEFSGSAVVLEDTGKHLLEVELPTPQYQIGRYLDIWTINVVEDEPVQTIVNCFDIYPQLWYTTPTPVVYDFNYHFQPNRLRQGSKQYLIIEIHPNVPRASDLQKYYENLAIASDLRISIEQCGPCAPSESDLRLIVDDELISYREKKLGYYQLDATEMNCGIYNVWFKLTFGGNIYLSDKMQLQIF